MDLDDFDDLGLGSAPVKPPPRPSRFLPKSAKLVPKQEPHHPNLVSPELDVKPTIAKDAPMEERRQEPPPEPMAVDGGGGLEEEEEDYVVREIDVFLAPEAEAGTELYLMQYPLRPAWRPYEFGEKCREVRANPKEGRLEVDLELNTEMNYDHSAPERLQIEKQTLSARRAPLETSYAVGILDLEGNKLHLNPVDAVMQLRPSMEHLAPKGLKKSTTDESSGVKDLGSAKKPGKAKTGKAAAGASTSEDPPVEDPWIQLEYHGLGSFKSNQCQRKMISQESSSSSSEIPFSMNPLEYMQSLCPASAGARGGLSIRSLLAMPLEARLKKWLFEGPQLKRFSAIRHLTPKDSVENVFEVLQQHAWLVQGLWVPKSAPQKFKNPFHRDIVIGLFQKNTVISGSDFTRFQLSQKDAEPHLSALAVYRSSSATWELKEPKDESFIRSHPDVVKKQEEKWRMQEKKLMEHLEKRRNDGRTGAKR